MADRLLNIDCGSLLTDESTRERKNAETHAAGMLSILEITTQDRGHRARIWRHDMLIFVSFERVQIRSDARTY